MPSKLVGRKCGMTRIFTEDGTSIPVSVLLVEPNRVTQIKTIANDGYQALQIITGNKRPSLLNKATAGHFAKAKMEAGLGLWEFRLENGQKNDLEVGSEIKVDTFAVGERVDISGTSIGKGFQGIVKLHNFAMQDATHGNSRSHRVPGSIGQRQTPGRVFPGKKMAGRMGNVKRTVANLEIIRVDVEKNLLCVKGAIPGAPGGFVTIAHTVKHKQRAEGEK